MLLNFLKTPNLFITYGGSGGQIHHPVIPITGKSDQSIEIDRRKFGIIRSRSLRKTFHIRDDEGNTHELKSNSVLSIKMPGNSYMFRIIYEWGNPGNRSLKTFLLQSFLFHAAVILGFAIYSAAVAPKVERPENLDPTAERVKELLSKMQDKTPLKIVKEAKPKPAPEKVVVKKKEKKRQGVFPTKQKVAEKTVRNRRAVAARSLPSGARTSAKSGGGAKSIESSLSFLSSSGSKGPSLNNGSAKRGRSFGPSYGKGGIPIGKGIKSGSKLGEGAASSYSGPIETRGIRSVKSAVYGDGRGYGGGGKSLNSVQGTVTTRALRGSNRGHVGGALTASGGLSLSGKGKVSEALIQKALNKRIARLTYCYEKALLTDSSLAGTIKMQWTIQPGGAVQSVKVVRSELNNSKLHRCLVREIEKTPFPKPKGGTATVQYPFKFKASTI